MNYIAYPLNPKSKIPHHLEQPKFFNDKIEAMDWVSLGVRHDKDAAKSFNIFLSPEDEINGIVVPVKVKMPRKTDGYICEIILSLDFWYCEFTEICCDDSLVKWRITPIRNL